MNFLINNNFLKPLSITKKANLLIGMSLFFVAFSNVSFFNHVLNVYPLTAKNSGFLASVVIVLMNVIVILLTLISSKYTTKPLLIFLLIAASFASYFMDSYGVIIDHHMIDNTIKTDVAEALDLLNAKLLLYVFFLGLLPSFYIAKVNISYQSFREELIASTKIISMALLLSIVAIVPFSDFYASFIREHKSLRFYANPIYYLYSINKYIKNNFKHNDNHGLITPLGLDAHITTTSAQRKLIILVVGETARADRFSLNGYKRKTNPQLEQESIISFINFSSCGTSTAVSVPCLFSASNKNEFDLEQANDTENLLDVLSHAGVNVLWRDNNSDSKGVALRVAYENYRTPGKNTICDIECRDEGMLIGLQDYIKQQSQGDILIVLHQMGNHGPAYYKRYPKRFERFKPTCQTNLLEDCSLEEIGNSYDNAILYTDYFLAKAIKLLKNNTKAFKTALFYVSDHGESLGENGLYLHGLPYLIAPKNQTHVAAVMWFGQSFLAHKKHVFLKKTKKLSHDNVFHTLLGLMEIATEIYDQQMDILNS